MTRREIISSLKEYFDIRELVCCHTYEKFGDTAAWQFLRTDMLHNLLVIRRDILKTGMVCNNYFSGGKYSQRGLRCNLCQEAKTRTISGKIYLSAHCCGSGYDFTVLGMSAEQARQMIERHRDLLPYPLRMEDKVSWLHVDSYDNLSGLKIRRFQP